MQKPQHEKKQYINQYMAEKAGMGEVDKDKIAQIVQKITEGSHKSLYEKQMSQKRQLQLAQMLRKTLQFTSDQKKQMKQDWLQQIQQMKQSMNLDKCWAHLDFDMFYIACQLLDRPQLKDKPCAVGGQFSIICTANYVARKYGIRSALPTFIAKKLCPQIVMISPDFSKYKKFSNIFRDILRKFDEDLQSMGLDEAYIQLTQHFKNKTIEEQGEFINNIRLEIFNQTGLTVSCGVGANKMLAKLASEQKKPDGQFILQNQSQKILDFMRYKKIRKIPGIGPVNQYFLKGLGIQNAESILSNTDVLSICFSRNSTQFYISTALGLGSTQHEYSQRKSLGKSQTFKANNDLEYLFQKTYYICEQVCMELQQLGYVTKNVVFTYQNQMFLKKDKTFQLKKYTSAKQELIEHILPYLQTHIQTKGQKIRLLGARCTSILKIEDLRKIQLDKYLVKTVDGIQPDDIQTKSKPKFQNPGLLIFFCPICNEQIDCKGNLAAFNRHFDKCMLGELDQKLYSKNESVLKCKNQQNFDRKPQQKSNSRNLNIERSEKSLSQKRTVKSGSLLNFFKKKE